MADHQRGFKTDFSKARDTQQWIRSKVDYTQEEKKNPYTFINGISFMDCLLPSLQQCTIEAKRLFVNSVFDQDMAADLETAEVLNWCSNTVKLFAIKVSGDGSCLLHAVSFAMWGVEDTMNTLRQLLLITITLDHNNSYRNRWCRQRLTDLKLLENTQKMLDQEWDDVIRSISNLGSTSQSAAVTHRFLESIHIYVLANILRRPIIVVADSQVKSVTGVHLQDDHMGGIYLPLEWSPSECCKTPLIIGYSYNHFCPLISENDPQGLSQNQLFPLVNKDWSSLSVRYLTEEEDKKILSLAESYFNIRDLDVLTQNMTATKLPCALLTFKPLKPEFNALYAHLQTCVQKYKERYGVEQIQEPLKQLNILTPGNATAASKANPYDDIQSSSQTKVVPMSGNFSASRINERNYAQTEILTPTAPPLSLPSSGNPEPLSMMNERCQNKNCGFRCSTYTFPFCHECFKEEQSKVRQQQMLINPPTAPMFSSRSFATGNTTAYFSGDLIPKQHETESTPIKSSMLEHEPSQYYRPASGTFAKQGSQGAFAETETKTSERDLVVSEEPSLSNERIGEAAGPVKCASPVCDAIVEAGEKLCSKCKDILMNSNVSIASKQQGYGMRASQPMSEINSAKSLVKTPKKESQPYPERLMECRANDEYSIGSLAANAQLQKEQQLHSGYKWSQMSTQSNKQYHPTDDVKGNQGENQRQSQGIEAAAPYETKKSTLLKGQTQRGKPCKTLACPNFGDPANEGMCSRCFASYKQAIFLSHGEHLPRQNRETSSYNTSHQGYVHNETGSYHNLSQTKGVQHAQRDYHFENMATVSFSPYDTEEPKSLVVTSMTSRYETPKSHAASSYQPSAGDAESKLKEVEEWSKRRAVKCLKRGCQNFGNKEKGGLCNSCYNELYGEDVPDIGCNGT